MLRMIRMVTLEAMPILNCRLQGLVEKKGDRETGGSRDTERDIRESERHRKTQR